MNDPFETRGAILEALYQSPERWVSGGVLAGRLGLSRTAVSNHVAELRGLGYEIESAPAKGYRLGRAPDTVHPIELRRHLEGGGLGAEIHYFEKTDSTNTQAARLAGAGAPHGTLVIADSQSAGRGRLGRSWASPPGENLYFSLILRPALEPHRIPQITLLGAVALARAVEGVLGGAPRIKWPNDLLWEGRKFAGILTEMTGDSDRVRWVLLGVGVNVATRRFPQELAPLATSLALIRPDSPPPARARLLGRILAEIAQALGRYEQEGFGPIGKQWEQYARIAGQRVSVSAPRGEKREGLARGLAPDGALLLEGPEGDIERVMAGDVTLL